MIAVVTGSQSGIGKAVKEKLIQNGVQVISVDKDCQGGDKDSYAVDVSDEKQVIMFWEQMREKYEKIDFLVNCAGIFFYQERKKIFELPVEEIEQVFRVNFIGNFLMLREAIPHLKKAEGGSVVCISSDQTIYPRKGNLPYIVSKDAVNGLVQTAAVELCKDQIRVNGIAAASVRTRFIDSMFEPEKISEVYAEEDKQMPFGLIEADDIAELVFFLLSDKSRRITGQIYLVDSGKYLFH